MFGAICNPDPTLRHEVSDVFLPLTLLHFKVVPSRDRDDCSACVKPLSFQGNLQNAFTCHPHAEHQFLNVPEEGQFIIREN
jgi:hypothetical protein